MSWRVSVTFSDEQAKYIKNIASTEVLKDAEVVRRLVDKGISLEVTNQNLELIVQTIQQVVKAELDPQVERLAAINYKSGLASATAMYLNAEAINKLVPINDRISVSEAFDRGRKKGIAYMSNKNYREK